MVRTFRSKQERRWKKPSRGCSCTFWRCACSRAKFTQAGMLVGRERELAKLSTTIVERKSLLVWGAAGSGKTALLQAALSSLGESLRRRCIVCETNGSPSIIWQRLVKALAEADDSEVLTRMENEAGSSKL